MFFEKTSFVYAFMTTDYAEHPSARIFQHPFGNPFVIPHHVYLFDLRFFIDNFFWIADFHAADNVFFRRLFGPLVCNLGGIFILSQTLETRLPQKSFVGTFRIFRFRNENRPNPEKHLFALWFRRVYKRRRFSFYFFKPRSKFRRFPFAHARAGPPAVHEFFAFVTAEQQRAHARFFLFRPRKTAYDEFLPPAAFEFYPVAVASPRVRRVESFADYALKSQLFGGGKTFLSLSYDKRTEFQKCGSIFQKFFQFLLPLSQRQGTQVLSVFRQNIERHIRERSTVRFFYVILQCLKIRTAFFVRYNHFAVEHESSVFCPFRGFLGQSFEFIRKIQAVSRNKTDFSSFRKGDDPIPVVFHLIYPFVAARRFVNEFCKLNFYLVERIFRVFVRIDVRHASAAPYAAFKA